MINMAMDPVVTPLMSVTTNSCKKNVTNLYEFAVARIVYDIYPISSKGVAIAKLLLDFKREMQ